MEWLAELMTNRFLYSLFIEFSSLVFTVISRCRFISLQGNGNEPSQLYSNFVLVRLGFCSEGHRLCFYGQADLSVLHQSEQSGQAPLLGLNFVPTGSWHAFPKHLSQR